MRKHYPWLWLDADGTLFDYNPEPRPDSLQVTYEISHLRELLEVLD